MKAFHPTLLIQKLHFNDLYFNTSLQNENTMDTILDPLSNRGRARLNLDDKGMEGSRDSPRAARVQSFFRMTFRVRLNKFRGVWVDSEEL